MFAILIPNYMSNFGLSGLFVALLWTNVVVQVNPKGVASKKHLSLKQHQVLNPCNFPTPGVAAFRRCTDYTELSYLCDATALISRTEADAFDLIVRQSFSSCFCRRGSFQCERKQNDRKPTLAVSMFALASADKNLLTNLTCLDIDPQFLTAGNIGHIYAESMRHRWSSRQCSIDVAVVLIRSWLFPEGRKLAVNRPFISLSERATNSLSLARRATLRQLIDAGKTASNVVFDAGSIWPALLSVSSALTELDNIDQEQMEPEPVKSSLNLSGSGMPNWALILLICSAAFSVFLVALGDFVNKINSRMTSSGRQFNARARNSNTRVSAGAYNSGGSNSKWGVGFGGGLWDVGAGGGGTDNPGKPGGIQ